MLKFTYQYEEHGPLIEVTLPSDSILGDVFQSFEGFLKAAGYHFDGVIDLVDGEFERTN
jgi:hypothetical protein